MEIDFDPLKNARNIKERRLSFERVAEVDFNTALVFPDTRKAYSETRYIALCYLDRRLHVLCFTETDRSGNSDNQLSQGQCKRGNSLWQAANP